MATASGEAGFGAINAVAQFEMFFLAGFTLSWWVQANAVIWLFIVLCGFIIYRYRESRVMTLAQFFEIRYSKSFRVFAGFMAFLSGLLAYGIYPAVGARFFIYFCGLPETVTVLGQDLSTFVIVMIILQIPGILLTVLGGQLVLMAVDCVEGIISMMFYLVIAIALLWIFSLNDISQALTSTAPGHSLVNPFDAAATKDFNFWYMMIAIFAAAYGWQSQQAGHGFRSAAINAHEQKMGSILGPWRNEARTLMLTVLCICVYCFMNHPHFADGAASVHQAIGHIQNPQIQKQMEAPAALGHMLPTIIRGMFAAIMLFALISTDCTMIHSWSTIFVQDVIVPLQKTPLTTKRHLSILRIAVIGVSLYAFTFSLLFKQTQYILMFFAFAAALFSGAGAAIIGGFYWRKGTSAGAWAAMLGGGIISVGGLLLDKNWKMTVYPWLSENTPGLLSGMKWLMEEKISGNIPAINWVINPDSFPLNGQWILFFSIIASIILYVSISLLTCRESFNLERMLHRGEYAVEDKEREMALVKRLRNWKSVLVGIDEQYTKGDRILAWSVFIWTMYNFAMFLVIIVWNLFVCRWSKEFWFLWWKWYSIPQALLVGSVTTVWFTIGGTWDLMRLFKRLDALKRNVLDDGRVVGHVNAEDVALVEAVEHRHVVAQEAEQAQRKAQQPGTAADTSTPPTTPRA